MTNAQEVLQIAESFYEQKPNWVIFFREILGVDGAIHKAFDSDTTAFRAMDEYGRIKEMLADLKRGTTEAEEIREEERFVLTIRLPKSLHKSIKQESKERKLSMNAIVIARCLVDTDESLLPNKK